MRHRLLKKMICSLTAVFCIFAVPGRAADDPPDTSLQIVRFAENPIIRAMQSPSIGDNVNGPSLIKVPDWLPNPLGRYYLYFAHHNGKFIRMAYAQELRGPWTIYEPGTLKLQETACSGHIASPDMYVDNDNRQIRMYFHGPVKGKKGQFSFAAHSANGLDFTADKEVLGESYFRVFQWKNYFYAMARSGELYRSRDGRTGFEHGGNPFETDTIRSALRHVAVKIDGSILTVLYSRIGDMPECIQMSTIDIAGDWKQWKAVSHVTLIVPETAYEGADLPLAPSVSGLAKGRVRELRDPALYREGNFTYVLYTVAGENGIAISEWKEK